MPGPSLHLSHFSSPMSTSIRTTLRAAYDRDAWLALTQTLFPLEALSLLATPAPLAAAHENVAQTLQLGTLTLPGDGESVALL